MAEQKQQHKVALITGITGQDGSFLTDLLLSKGYVVHGIVRQASITNLGRISHLYKGRLDEDRMELHDSDDSGNLFLHFGDMSDTRSLQTLIEKIQPDEVYNLAALSTVSAFNQAEYIAQITGLGVLRLVECLRLFMENTGKKVRIFQACSSELFGKVKESPQTEKTPFYPRSPYGVAKQFAFWTIKNYREAYGIIAVNGILFNHESSRRGTSFVTRKITKAAVRISLGLQKCLYLGNLNASRDWGHAKDTVRAMWMSLQHHEGNDYVIATGTARTVREFVEIAFRHCNMKITWSGENTEEIGKDEAGNVVVRVDPQFFRPTEVDHTVGDTTFIRETLGWEPEYSFSDLVEEMVKADFREERRQMQIGESLVVQ